MPKLKPTGNKVIIKRAVRESVTEHGIFIPESNQPNRSNSGVVIAVGPGAYDSSGTLIPMTVRVGDVVYFPPYGKTPNGKSIIQEVEGFVVIREPDILAVDNKENQDVSENC